MPQQLNPTPTNTSIAVSGGGGNTTTSGTIPRGGWTGASGTFSGPHFIEEQSMHIDYWRDASWTWNTLNPNDFSLSSSAPIITNLSGSVAWSNVNVKVVGSVIRYKSDDLYGTSSFQQAQRFEVLSTSADAQGYTYGAVPTGALGPAGSIVTTQKFYSRRPWMSTDTSCSYTAEGYSYAFEPSGIGIMGQAGCAFVPNYGGPYGQGGDLQMHAIGLTYLTELKEREELRPTWNPDWVWIVPYSWSVPGRLMGPYQAANDQAYFVPQVVDWCGRMIQCGYSLYNGEIATEDPGTAANNYYPSTYIARGALHAFDASAGGAITEYDINRHDFS